MESLCVKYFSCFSTLKNYQTHSRSDNAKAAFCALTFLFPIVPLFMGGAYLTAWSFRKITEKSITDQKVSIVSDSTLATKSNPQPKINHSNIQSSSDHKRSLSKIGGFTRVNNKTHTNNNTCFIATKLQALRQVPTVRNRLFEELTQKTNESNELFTLRQKIKSTLTHLFKETDNGNTIGSDEFRKFHELLYQYSQLKDQYRISKPGEAGSQFWVFETIMKVLGLKDRSRDYSIAQMFDKKILDGILDLVKTEDITEQLDKSNAPFVVIKRSGNSEKLVPKNIPLEVTGRRGTYSLVSATGGTSNHAVAYLRERGQDGWVYCNDNSINKAQTISPSHNIDYLYYVKVGPGSNSGAIN